MSHITCLSCKSAENHVTGYGFAAGPLGGYTLCCEYVLEWSPDIDDLSEEQLEEARRLVKKAAQNGIGELYDI